MKSGGRNCITVFPAVDNYFKAVEWIGCNSFVPAFCLLVKKTREIAMLVSAAACLPLINVSNPSMTLSRKQILIAC